MTTSRDYSRIPVNVRYKDPVGNVTDIAYVILQNEHGMLKQVLENHKNSCQTLDEKQTLY